MNVNTFCRGECFRLARGIKTENIRPKNKKEVNVLVSGLDIDTPDGAVLEYLSFFGKVVKKEVIYCKHVNGFFKGKNNGDRRYLLDFSEGRDMGSYHIIDGANTTAGQSKTCRRCHGNSSVCPGGEIARQCEERGGQRVKLLDHMKNL